MKRERRYNRERAKKLQYVAKQVDLRRDGLNGSMPDKARTKPSHLRLAILVPHKEAPILTMFRDLGMQLVVTVYDGVSRRPVPSGVDAVAVDPSFRPAGQMRLINRLRRMTLVPILVVLDESHDQSATDLYRAGADICVPVETPVEVVRWRLLAILRRAKPSPRSAHCS